MSLADEIKKRNQANAAKQKEKEHLTKVKAAALTALDSPEWKAVFEDYGEKIVRRSKDKAQKDELRANFYLIFKAVWQTLAKNPSLQSELLGNNVSDGKKAEAVFDYLAAHAWDRDNGFERGQKVQTFLATYIDKYAISEDEQRLVQDIRSLLQIKDKPNAVYPSKKPVAVETKNKPVVTETKTAADKVDDAKPAAATGPAANQRQRFAAPKNRESEANLHNRAIADAQMEVFKEKQLWDKKVKPHLQAVLQLGKDNSQDAKIQKVVDEMNVKNGNSDQWKVAFYSLAILFQDGHAGVLDLKGAYAPGNTDQLWEASLYTAALLWAEPKEVTEKFFKDSEAKVAQSPHLKTLLQRARILFEAQIKLDKQPQNKDDWDTGDVSKERRAEMKAKLEAAVAAEKTKQALAEQMAAGKKGAEMKTVAEQMAAAGKKGVKMKPRTPPPGMKKLNLAEGPGAVLNKFFQGKQDAKKSGPVKTDTKQRTSDKKATPPEKTEAEKKAEADELAELARLADEASKAMAATDTKSDPAQPAANEPEGGGAASNIPPPPPLTPRKATAATPPPPAKRPPLHQAREAELAKLRKQLADKDAEVRKQLADKDAELQRRLADKEADLRRQMAEKDKAIALLKQALEEQKRIVKHPATPANVRAEAKKMSDEIIRVLQTEEAAKQRTERSLQALENQVPRLERGIQNLLSTYPAWLPVLALRMPKLVEIAVA